MSQKTARRSISVRGDTFAALRAHCAKNRVSMSDFVEQWARPILGLPSVEGIRHHERVVNGSLGAPAREALRAERRVDVAAAVERIAAKRQPSEPPPVMSPAVAPSRAERAARIEALEQEVAALAPPKRNPRGRDPDGLTRADWNDQHARLATASRAAKANAPIPPGPRDGENAAASTRAPRSADHLKPDPVKPQPRGAGNVLLGF